MSEVKTFGGRLNSGLLYPLGGLLIFFWLVLATVYVDLQVNVAKAKELGNALGNTPYLHPYTYLILLAIAVSLVSSLIGRRIAASKLRQNENTSLNRNVYTFTTITTMSALIAAVIYAIAIYMSNQFDNKGDAILRLLQLYIPIILDAALLVFGILRAFVVKPKEASK